MEESATIGMRHLFDRDVDASTDPDLCYRRLEEVAQLVRDLKEIQEEAMVVAELEMFSDSHRSELEKMIPDMKSEYIDLVRNENCLDSSVVVDQDTCLETLGRELEGIQAKVLRTSKEIEILAMTIAKDASYLEDELPSLEALLMAVDSKRESKDNDDADHDKLVDQLNGKLKLLKIEEVNWDEGKQHECSMLMGESKTFEALKLRDQLDQKRVDLMDLQRLDNIVKRAEAAKMVEDILCDMKVISYIDNCIKLSIKTSIPAFGGSTCEHKVDGVKESFTVEHKLLIKVATATMTLQDAELFPNDLPVGDTVNAAKTLRESMPLLTVLGLRGQLEYLVREIQHQIYCCTLRVEVLKEYAKTSRNSFQYSDRDQIITVNMFGGIKVFIKVPQKWPKVVSPLRVLSMKCLDQSSRDISLVVLCKAVEILNSLELSRRCNLLLFIDAVEEILLQQIRKSTNSGRMP